MGPKFWRGNRIKVEQIKWSKVTPLDRSRIGGFGVLKSTEIAFTPTQTTWTKGPKTFSVHQMLLVWMNPYMLDTDEQSKKHSEV